MAQTQAPPYAKAVGEIIVKGGTFTAEPKDDSYATTGINFVAPGYKAVQNTDGTWTVEKSPLTIIVR